MEKRMGAARYSVRSKIKTVSLPKSAIANNIHGLLRLIQRLHVKDGRPTIAQRAFPDFGRPLPRIRFLGDFKALSKPCHDSQAISPFLLL